VVLGHDPGCQPPNERAKRASEECSEEQVRSEWGELKRASEEHGVIRRVRAVWKQSQSQLGLLPPAATATARLKGKGGR